MVKHKDIIGFDLDGVLYPWHREVWDYLSIWKPELVGGLNYFDFWTQIETGEVHFSDAFWTNLVELEDLYSSALPLQADLEMLRKLALDYEFWYVTHRGRSCQFVTRSYLKRYNYPYSSNLIFASGSKRRYVESLGCKYFVEDRTENILDLENSTNIIVVRQPYNQKIWGHRYGEINNILDLPDILSFLDDTEKGLM